MIRHHLKLAIRNIQRKGFFSVLNIVGLSVGLASFLIIGLYVFQESTFERGFSKADRTYRVYTKFLNASLLATSSPNLSTVLNEQPEIEVATYVSKVFPKSGLNAKGKVFQMKDYLQTDPYFLKVFDYELLYGSPDLSFQNPGSLILTENEAIKLFGRADVVGEMVNIDSEDVFVTGVLKPTSSKTHLNFNALWVKDFKKTNPVLWASISVYTYAVLVQNVKAEQLDKRLDYIMKDHIFPGVLKALPIRNGYTFEEWKDSGRVIRNYAQPISEIHLESTLGFDFPGRGDKKTVLTFFLVAIFILFISCVNFINLSTAKASDRSKEIGVKKVMGATRRILIIQLLFETLLITAFSGLLALGLAELSLALIKGMFPDFITISLVGSSLQLFPIISVVLIVGFISGIYPALYLSSFRVTSLLKGQKQKGNQMPTANWLRNTLVIVQFTLSSGLIIFSILVFQQLSFMKQIELGFDPENILVVENAGFLRQNSRLLKDELATLSFVEDYSSMFRIPGETLEMMSKSMEVGEEEVYFDEFLGDAKQLSVLGLELESGEFFSERKPGMVINETAAKLLGNSDALGKTFNGKTVIGIVKDFHYRPLREKIGPVMIQNYDEGGFLLIKMPLDQANIEAVASIWSKFSDLPIQYHFLEQNYESFLKNEQEIGKAFTLFTALAIFISCLGMYGLVLFAADQRSKEFGIRRVLGASILDIIKLLVNTFMKLAFVALVLAFPLSFWATREWLSDFAYRTSISPVNFLMGALFICVAVVITVYRQSYLSATKNPIETLKSE
ncbi:ABC transporter permease [Roseivirga echinicomitans]|uniref:Cell division protein FtsX n=1 Tax=Roseivirga echinicomitans TaxID=296218 RepID=A0A150WZM8_9BACT|nr:ABC transporter permease [Roseivirga echinicomitans]KYG71941.1 hypothetical protein AWN68_12220 [Roseivirga echinicomitans]